MAMTFTLVTLLREKLSQLIRVNAEKQKTEEMEKERRLLEVIYDSNCTLYALMIMQEEEARTRGTPVTVESFKVWKTKFDKKLAAKKAQEEEEKLKAMTPKEREEYKRLTSRLSGKPWPLPELFGMSIVLFGTGRHLFERNKHLEDESLMEEGTVSVDVSQYDRSRDREDTEENIVTFSDSE